MPLFPPRMTGGLGAQVEQPAGGLGGFFGNALGGLGSFNERHPGLVVGLGQTIAGNDIWPAIAYNASARKERAAKAEAKRKEGETRRWLQAKHPDLVPLVDAGMAEQAIAEGFRREKGGDKQGLINAGDGNIYNPNDDSWIRAPNAQQGLGGFRFDGNSVEAQALNGLIESGQLTPHQAQQLGAGKTVTGPNGEIIFMTPEGVFSRPGNGAQGGNVQVTEPKVTLDERKAMTFADRLSTSGAIIDQLEAAGTSASDAARSSVPLIGNWLVSGKYQQLDQAKRDFINAQLRRESGAVISEEEFDNANRQYFPQPGDTPATLAQKRANRKIVIDGMKRDSGPTYGGGAEDPLGLR